MTTTKNYSAAMESLRFTSPVMMVIASIPVLLGFVLGSIWRGLECGFHVGRNV